MPAIFPIFIGRTGTPSSAAAVAWDIFPRAVCGRAADSRRQGATPAGAKAVNYSATIPWMLNGNPDSVKSGVNLVPSIRKAAISPVADNKT